MPIRVKTVKVPAPKLIPVVSRKRDERSGL
jgi:hypothetical protein